MQKRIVFILSALLFSYPAAMATASKAETRAEVEERILDWDYFSKEVVSVSESLKNSSSKQSDCVSLGELMGLALGYYNKWQPRINSGIIKFGLRNTGSYTGNFERFTSYEKNTLGYIGTDRLGFIVSMYCKGIPEFGYHVPITKETVLEKIDSHLKDAYKINSEFFGLN